MAEEGLGDSVALVRGLLAAAEACGVHAGKLARDAQIPNWVLSAELPMMLPVRYAHDIWELTDQALGTADVPLAMASRYAPGRFSVLDYLFATAPTVGDGLAAAADAMHLWTTNGRLQIGTGDDRTVTWSYDWRLALGDRAEGLAWQYVVISVMRGIRLATGRPVVPSQVTFAHDAPRSHRALSDTLGTGQLHFGAPLNTITFRAGDLDLPLPGADPVLAGILTRYVRSLPAAPPADWREQFRGQLAQALAASTPTLAEVSRRMAASTRTVQRRLAEYDTTWRAELEAARQRLAGSASADRATMARRLGYADARSVRRVLRQWDNHS